MTTKKNTKTNLVAKAPEPVTLVGCWGSIWRRDENGKAQMKHSVYIAGRADEKYFIVQVLNSLTGEPNVARLVTAEQMVGWDIYPDKATAELCIGLYWEKGERVGFDPFI